MPPAPPRSPGRSGCSGSARRLSARSAAPAAARPRRPPRGPAPPAPPGAPPARAARGAPDVADLALVPELGHGAERLLDRHLAVDAVELIEVYRLQLQAPEAALDGLPYVLGAAVGPPVPRPRAHEAEVGRGG